MRRPALPRASSAMSGFFFCGMIDDPVEKASSQRHEAKLDRGPRDDLLRDAREVNADHRGHPHELGDHVARRRRVDRVLGGPAEPKFCGDGNGIQPQRRTGERARTVRRQRRARVPVAQALDVAQQRPHVREQARGRASRAARAGSACGRAWALRRAPPPARTSASAQAKHERGDLARMPAQVHALERGDLVVARPAGAQASAKFRANALDQNALERAVHVLVGVRRQHGARGDVFAQLRRGRRPCGAASSFVSSPAARKRVRVRDRAGKVVVRVAPVEVSGLTQCARGRRRDRRRTGRPTAPLQPWHPRWLALMTNAPPAEPPHATPPASPRGRRSR